MKLKNIEIGGFVMPGLNGDDRRVPDYLAVSILVTIFCCLPFGIPAIVYSAMAKSKKEAGDFDGAQKDAKQAGNWCVAACIAGIITILIWAIASQ